MNQDPWAAPEAPGAPAPGGRSDFRPLGGLTRLVIGLLLGALALRWLGLLGQLWLALVEPGVLDSAEALPTTELGTAVLVGTGFLALAALALTLLGAPAWVAWHWRAGSNLVATGREDLRHEPRGHAGWWFVPFANLVMPYRAMRELYGASAPVGSPGAWSMETLPATFPIWWGCWLVGNALSNLSLRLSLEGVGAWSILGLDWAAEIVGSAATALYLKYVWEIDGRQRALAGLLGR